MKISTRLFLYISSLIILSSIGLGCISVRDERIHLMEEAKMTARILARTLATTFKYYHITDQHQRLAELIHAVIPPHRDVNNLLINIYDSQGKLVDLSFEHGVTRHAIQRDRKPVDFSREESEQIITEGNHEYFSVISPIKNSSGTLHGGVEILLSLDSINNTLAGLVRKFIVFIVLTALLLGLILYLVCHWNITLPIGRLKEAAKNLGHGDLGLRIGKSGVAELDELIEEFNRMAHNIEKQNRKKEQLFREKINLERGLRHQDKLASIGQLASGLAHEIGTPLNVISGRAEYLLQKRGDSEARTENLKVIIRQAERITKIIQQMLAFSRKPTAQFKQVELETLITESFTLCRLKQRKNHPVVELELDLGIKKLTADSDGLRQLFVNLMLNSFHSMKTGGTIKVSSRTAETEEPGELILTYEDNGEGIPADLAERIFDPFFTTKEVGEGTGLGLYMVASIIQEHQGRITVDREVSRGARFIIHLPAHPHRTTTTSAAA
ncbi:ATP-binding protein [Desulfolithobacter sp.]